MGTLDHDLGDRGLLQHFHQHRTDTQIFMKKRGIFGFGGDPTAIPCAVDAETQPNRIDFLTHRLLLKPWLRFHAQ